VSIDVLTGPPAGVAAAATAAGLGAALTCRPGAVRLLGRRVEHTAGRGPRVPAAPGSATAALVGVLGCAVLVAVLGAASLLLVAACAVVALGAGWLHGGARRRRAVARGRRQAIEACDALVAELRAGQPPVRALHRAAEHHPRLAPVARAGALGGDVLPALRQVAGMPGLGGLGVVAAAWQVAEASGSSLVSVLLRVTETLREDDAVAAEVTAALAPARATARLLAVLPVFGLLLGSGLGGDPVALLLGTAVGNALLLAGVLLALAGTVWVERLADRVQP
jgi:tight adherence protein B